MELERELYRFLAEEGGMELQFHNIFGTGTERELHILWNGQYSAILCDWLGCTIICIQAAANSSSYSIIWIFIRTLAAWISSHHHAQAWCHGSHNKALHIRTTCHSNSSLHQALPQCPPPFRSCPSKATIWSDKDMMAPLYHFLLDNHAWDLL